MLESVFNKVIIKKRLQYRCFPANIAKFLRTAFYNEHLRWLELLIVIVVGGILQRFSEKLLF